MLLITYSLFPIVSSAVSADPLLVWNYGAMAVLAFVGGIAFWLSFRHLDKEEDALNALQEGHYESGKAHHDGKEGVKEMDVV